MARVGLSRESRASGSVGIRANTYQVPLAQHKGIRTFLFGQTQLQQVNPAVPGTVWQVMARGWEEFKGGPVRTRRNSTAFDAGACSCSASVSCDVGPSVTSKLLQYCRNRQRETFARYARYTELQVFGSPTACAGLDDRQHVRNAEIQTTSQPPSCLRKQSFSLVGNYTVLQ